tara:strand:+ start:46 stop:222 length:177 start_codon:yes stop_codon:yes gene_type:complete
MEKEKKKTIVPQKFQEMYIIMGGNPNYRDTENFIYNKKTCLLEDKPPITKLNNEEKND